jgi:uncharacterized protein YabE (DUF348 family)
LKLPNILMSSSLAVALLLGSGAAATSLHKDVTLEVDGRSRPAGAFALTVGDVLAGQGIKVEPGDIVIPSVDTPVNDGDVVQVKFLKSVTIDVDGEERVITTNASTVRAALSEVAIPELSTAAVSMPLATRISHLGAEIEVTTEKAVKVAVANEKQSVNTTSRSVADLLTELNITLDADDRVTPDPQTLLTEGAQIQVDRVEVTEKTVKEKIDFDTKVTKNSSMWISEKKVTTAGKAGKAERTYRITTVNGKEDSRELLSEKVLTKPVTQVEVHGTKASSHGVKINLARAAQWDRIAKCESGNRWHINTGNGYYGGLQFSKASWDANGGRDFAAYPHQASREEQITIANRYYAKAGFRPWSCRRVL